MIYGFQDVKTAQSDGTNLTVTIAQLVGKASTALVSTVVGVILKRFSEGFFYVADGADGSHSAGDLGANIRSLDDTLRKTTAMLAASRDAQKEAITTQRNQNTLLRSQTATIFSACERITALTQWLKKMPTPPPPLI